MTLFTVALVVAAVTLGAGAAAAHVAPSVDDNNRYLKVTPMRGGFRLAYTVFFGEIPGASERKQLDENRDGRIDDAEAKRFGDKVAAQVGASLEVDTTGAKRGSGSTHRVQWTIVDVGLGTPSVTAGAFSVDMIAYICAPSGRLRIRDLFRIPRPGETEVLVEDSPGVTVASARIGPSADPTRAWRFLGAGGPLSDDGLEVAWSAGDKAPLLPRSATCADTAGDAADGEGRGTRSGLWIGLLALVGAVVVAAGIVVGRRMRR